MLSLLKVCFLFLSQSSSINSDSFVVSAPTVTMSSPTHVLVSSNVPHFSPHMSFIGIISSNPSHASSSSHEFPQTSSLFAHNAPPSFIDTSSSLVSVFSALPVAIAHPM